ncbi:MAG: hypothetical protein COA52_18725 [Hyphomicrobiales bacterium]|nr:MAG: hypothetical protein COA52_18725 [Hyphomicrobiales bacterium]
MCSVSPVLKRIDADLQNSIARWFTLLRIKSISTDPAYKDDCTLAANWLVDELNAMGFTATRRDTPGHPMVIAHNHDAGENVPHVLFYGHYDVQPVDPLELWDTPPFEPEIREVNGQKQVFARGAADDKGQLLTFVEACRAYMAVHGHLPLRISILFEGEEESGSPSLDEFLHDNADELRADFALVCDTNMYDAQTPAIDTMLRGMVYEELTITAASRDLHSGLYGGAAQNPIRVLSKILAGLHDDDGRITLPNFYDGVEELEPELAAAWQALNFDADAFLGAVGLSKPAGEVGYPAQQQIWSRPTCDVNGIIGGYTGAGAKTVIASQASAKVSFRLVGDQDPHAIRAAFRAYVQSCLPEDCTVEFTGYGADKAVSLPRDMPQILKAQKALSEEWNRDAVLKGIGGSIPIVGEFKRVLGMDSLLIGFGQDDDAIHSPNEKYNLTSFHKGIRSWARVLDALVG